MNKRREDWLPEAENDGWGFLVDAPFAEAEFADAEEAARRMIAPFLNLSAAESTALLRSEMMKCVKRHLWIEGMMQRITVTSAVIWKRKVWLQGDFRESEAENAAVSWVLLKPPFPGEVAVPMWDVLSESEQELCRLLSGFREDRPPSGGAFLDLAEEVAEVAIEGHETLGDAPPGIIFWRARTGDIIVRESSGVYVWWRNACCERIVMAKNGDEFAERFWEHLQHGWKTHWEGCRTLWPFDGYGVPQ